MGVSDLIDLAIGAVIGWGAAYFYYHRSKVDFDAPQAKFEGRALGRHVPVSVVAVLALVEAFIAFLALYIAVCVRFETPFSHLPQLEEQLGPLWPRALLFSLIVVISLMAFGLYSPRQPRPPWRRAQLSDVLARVLLALIIASFAVAALFYLVPSLRLWRGVEALAVIVTGCGVVLARLVFALLTKR